MSEARPAPQPDQLVHDDALAWDMAHAQKPYWEDEYAVRSDLMSIPEAHIKTRESLLNTAASVAVEGAQAAEEVQQNYKPDGPDEAVTSDNEESMVDKESDATPEDIWSPEQIEEFVKSNLFGVAIYTNRFEHRILSKDSLHRTLVQRGQADLDRFIKEDLAGSLSIVNEQETAEYVPEGISELVTLVPWQDLAGQTKNGYSSKSGLASRVPGYVLMYKTLTRGLDPSTGKNIYDEAQQEGHNTRYGTYTTFNVPLTKEQAAELLGQIRQRPEVVRDIMEALALSGGLDDKYGKYTDSVSTNGLTMSEFWNGTGQEHRKRPIVSRPPYEAWAEVNGGINRIALRTDINAGPDQAEILEF